MALSPLVKVLHRVKLVQQAITARADLPTELCVHRVTTVRLRLGFLAQPHFLCSNALSVLSRRLPD